MAEQVMDANLPFATQPPNNATHYRGGITSIVRSGPEIGFLVMWMA
jgi:hypothetical protein